MTRSPSAFRPVFPAALLALLCLLAPLFAFAQSKGLEIDIVGGNAAALPIAVVPMPYQGAAIAPKTDIAEVVAADLARSGQFRTLTGTGLGTQRPTKGSEIDFGFFQQAKQSYIVVGRVLDAADGGYRVEYELYDIAKNRMLAFALTARANAMRDVAHQVADAIYEKITGVRGAFWTRIAYVVQTGVGKGARYSLMIADSDGYNPHSLITNSLSPIMSPAWHPDGRRLAFVSFDRGNSAIYIMDITRDTALPAPVVAFRGINSAPAFSPDGRRLAMALSKSGNLEIYVMDLGSRALTQLTNQFAIDTEPTWSADGSRIYFTSDRGGRPQIYQVPSAGGSATRLSFQGTYNARATVSFDGKKIAMAQGSGNNYRIALMDSSLGSARWSMLSPGSQDESPSFAPNAAMVLYAASEGSRGVLYAVSADARVRQRLVVSGGDVREPAWGPYRLPR